MNETANKIKVAQLISTVVGGVAVGFNVYYAGKRANAATKNAEAANRNAEAAENGQITERFSRSVEQLGSPENATRTGSIYALERLANDSPKDHWNVMEILSDFIRQNSPLEGANQNDNDQSDEIKNTDFRTDIQAALTVIGRRNHDQDPDQKSKRVNLSRANLKGYDLSHSFLYYAYFRETILQEAELEGIVLQKANLISADLRGAKLGEAELQNAHCEEADLADAQLILAKLQQAKLSKAKGLTQCQIQQAEGDSDTELPAHLERPEHWK